MAIVIMGLGNPGKEYEKTRHNAGRMAVELLAKQEGFDAFVLNKKAEALLTEGKIAKGNKSEKVTLVLPETFMNKSGKSALALVKSVKAAKQLIVVRDDLDLPIGVTKMTFARGSGGHKGVESIMRAIKTDQFAQLKIGISGQGKKNQAKKVSGEEKVLKHVIGKFAPKDEAAVKKSLKKSAESLRLFVTDGIEAATMFANTR
ncbi:MAG TPA: aminoacyl-tRNA hydrolase [Candidatus Paceibacterota bacterium]|nr:aminoacyl-tRNA hydrolase [Candidatus Paceibacterota bacterium]